MIPDPAWHEGRLRSCFSTFIHHLRVLSRLWPQPWREVVLSDDERSVQLIRGRRRLILRLGTWPDGGGWGHRAVLRAYVRQRVGSEDRIRPVAHLGFDERGEVLAGILSDTPEPRYLTDADSAYAISLALWEQAWDIAPRQAPVPRTGPYRRPALVTSRGGGLSAAGG